MKKTTLTCLHLICAGLLCQNVQADTFTLDRVDDVVVPSTRGDANTTWFGWETFDDPGAGNAVYDTTPDIGTSVSEVVFATANGENHRSGSGNIYVGTNGHTLYEQVTVAASGTPGTSGSTTIIAQLVTAFGDFPGPITMSQINGVNPVVVRGVNAAGKGQIWAKWQIPGHAALYTFTLTGPAGVTAYSIDRLVVDTHWNSTTPQPDIAVAASPPTFQMDQQSTAVVPTTRGQVNTTWFGWDTFCEVGFDHVPIDDVTPDIGTTATGVRFRTTNGEDHISSSRNLYVGAGMLAEEVTVVTDGVVGTGFTTLIAQAVTAFGGFPNASLSFGSINGVAPQVVQTTNLAGKGQVWAKWRLPGNQESYSFTVTGPAGVSGWSFDQFVVDTYWSAEDYQADTMEAGNPALLATLDQVADVLAPSSRGTANTTWFGWEVFTNPAGNAVDPINDDTPDIGTTITGVSLVTQNGQDHLSSTNNIYAGSNGMSLHERVTVATNAPAGTPAAGANSGTTTIIAQAVTQAGAIRTPIHFGSINGIAPTVVTATNAAGKGQVWVKWIIPGNPSSSYTFDITSDVVTGPATSISIDRLVVDTVWRLSGSQPDMVRATTPSEARVLSAVSDAVVPSTRGHAKTTWFGWETFNNLGNRVMGVSVIDDSTPDIGHTTTAGARFRTANGEGHLLASGNLYFLSGTLAEQITVPTNGTVGGGFTTVILQIVSATGAPGGDNAFAGPITLDIDGTLPVSQVEGANGGGAGQLWAKWELPGNEASYTINVAGPPNQAHFSIDRVVVDTWWSASGYQGDSMAQAPVGITTVSPLPVGGAGAAYAAQLAATGGTAPCTFSLVSGTLPDGLTLHADGLLAGVPVIAGDARFTVLATDENGLTASKEFDLSITTTPVITTAASLPTGLTGAAYTQTLAATGGAAPYTWSVVMGSSLPAGLNLDAGTGTISGIPAAAGVLNFDIEVADANGFSNTQSFSVTLIDLTILSASHLPNAVRNVAYTSTLNASGGLGAHTWSVAEGSLLPTGIEFSAGGVLSGTPAVSGEFVLTLQVSDGTFTVSREFSLRITDKPQRPSIPGFSFPVATIGAEFNHTLTGLDYPKSFAASGLPPGLKLHAATGVITGRPALSGAFNVKVRASNTGGISPWLTVPLIVRALDKNLVGSFTGLVARDAAANQTLGARLELTSTTKGSYTVKVTTGTKAASAKGFLSASAPQVSVPVSGSLLELSLNAMTGEITGTHGGVPVNGWRSAWNVLANPADTREGYYSFALDLETPSADAALPQGSGFATCTVNLAGVLKIAGRSADGLAFTSAGMLGPQGQIALHTPQPKNLGSMHGWLELSEDEQGWFMGNTIGSSEALEPKLTWVKLADSKTRLYAAGFPEQALVAGGGYLGASSKGVALGLPEAGAMRLSFAGGGVEALTTAPDTEAFGYTDENKVVTPPAAQNPAKVALKLHPGTGAASGSFLVENTRVAFFGQVVRLTDGSVKTVGHFLLPQPPEPGQKANAAPMRSGRFLITQ